ncbi:MAG: hypothetical protein ABIJ30_04725 [bacterium]
MALCIYCNKQAANSGEHVMPACMGKFRNSEQLHDKLCIDCNNEIGKSDEQFCRCGPEAFFRIIKGIKGRKHHERVNPFYRGSTGGKPIEIKMQHPYIENCEIFCETEEGAEKSYPARQVIVRDSNGKHHPILIPNRIRETRDLQGELELKGIANSEFVEWWLSVGDGEKQRRLIERLCAGLNGKIKWSETLPFQKTEKQNGVATFIVNSNYFQAIAKIAFHYFLKHFNQFTGCEREFDGIKQFIMNGGNPDRWVQQVKGSFVHSLNSRFITTDKYCHLLAINKNYIDIRAMLHFFVGPKIGPHRYYEVFIGKNPERIIYPQNIGHQFVYFDKPDKEGYSGRIDQLLTTKIMPCKQQLFLIV